MSAAPTPRLAAAKAAVAKTAEPKAVPQISPAKLMLREAAQNSWHAVAPPGCEPQDFDRVFGPFALLPRQIRRFDTLTLVDPAGRWWAHYLAIDGELGVETCWALLQSVELPPLRDIAEARVPEGYAIERGGVEDLEPWRSVRLKDGVVMNAGILHRTREECLRHLLDHAAVRGEIHPSIWTGQ